MSLFTKIQSRKLSTFIYQTLLLGSISVYRLVTTFLLLLVAAAATEGSLGRNTDIIFPVSTQKEAADFVFLQGRAEGGPCEFGVVR